MLTEKQQASAQGRKFVQDFLNANPCIDCGETDTRKLSFDHTRDKIANVSEMAWKGTPLDAIAAEIKKCDVRCLICHALKTAERTREKSSLSFSEIAARKSLIERVAMEVDFQSNAIAQSHLRPFQRVVVLRAIDIKSLLTRIPNEVLV